ncbi:hypothetical protein ASE14_18765 [Agromyces sp. Root81]|uniref:hypothetical protein n=1 Tax=Agromyces sp. Root81 TaxID=1736601 RepID=UPI0006F51A8C|nr:hypothetical protein [Agromyces sp. Root81]KRC58598.1 hypothetical protein ASE14_18765 [Agromyces sp. Root81]
MSEDRVWIDFSQDEALVLFEWIADFNELYDDDEHPTVEEFVRGKLEAGLQRQVNVLFSPRYGDEHREARARLQAEYGLDEDQPSA